MGRDREGGVEQAEQRERGHSGLGDRRGAQADIVEIDFKIGRVRHTPGFIQVDQANAEKKTNRGIHRTDIDADGGQRELRLRNDQRIDILNQIHFIHELVDRKQIDAVSRKTVQIEEIAVRGIAGSDIADLDAELVARVRLHGVGQDLLEAVFPRIAALAIEQDADTIAFGCRAVEEIYPVRLQRAGKKLGPAGNQVGIVHGPPGRRTECELVERVLARCVFKAGIHNAQWRGVCSRAGKRHGKAE